MALIALRQLAHTYATMLLMFGAISAQAENTHPASPSAPPKNDSQFAKGVICNCPFAIKEAYFDGHVLLLKSEHKPAHRSAYEDTAFTGLKVTFPTAEPIGTTSFYVITPDQEKMNANGHEQPRPALTVYYVEDSDWFTPLKYNGKYTMTLRFFEPVKGVLPGHIDLKTDSNGTRVKGYFYARKGTVATPL